MNPADQVAAVHANTAARHTSRYARRDTAVAWVVNQILRLASREYRRDLELVYRLGLDLLEGSE